MRRRITSLCLALTVAALATPAWAHVTVQPNEAPTGAFFRFVVRVPNERDDAATTQIELQFPPTVTNVSFQPKAGWEREITMVTLDEPIEVFGEEVTEAVGSVTWTGGSIAPGEFEEFGFSVRTPDDPTTLEFPAIQTYDSGEEVRWVGPADADEPAGRVAVIDLPVAEGQGQLALLAETAGEAESGTSTTTWVALGLGALGTLLGVAGLVRGRRT